MVFAYITLDILHISTQLRSQYGLTFLAHPVYCVVCLNKSLCIASLILVPFCTYYDVITYICYWAMLKCMLISDYEVIRVCIVIIYCCILFDHSIFFSYFLQPATVEFLYWLLSSCNSNIPFISVLLHATVMSHVFETLVCEMLSLFW